MEQPIIVGNRQPFRASAETGLGIPFRPVCRTARPAKRGPFFRGQIKSGYQRNGLRALRRERVIAGSTDTPEDKYSGLTVDLVGLGKVQLTHLLNRNTETRVYHTTHPRPVVKMFDLSCGKADEISYGPYMSFGLEVGNFGDILGMEDLRPFVPAYYGANINYHQKYAFIAMEYLEGQNLKSWC